jgi:hypothetical protein
MKKNIAIILGLLNAFDVQAYELATHARITQTAYMKSILATDTTLLDNLGIQIMDYPFGENYCDLSGATAKERGVSDDLELKYMPSSAKPLSIAGWLMRGAIREDDYASAFGIWQAPNPQDDQDPPQAFWRVMNHFFDSYVNRPLVLSSSAAWTFAQATGETVFQKAPTWASGAVDAFAAPPVPDSARRNHYSALDAREAMHRALTGKKQDGMNADPAASDNNPAHAAVRKKYWATTFRALGDILHLNQDMAQPQHTRNDPHSAGVQAYTQPSQRRMVG